MFDVVMKSFKFPKATLVPFMYPDFNFFMVVNIAKGTLPLSKKPLSNKNQFSTCAYKKAYQGGYF